MYKFRGKSHNSIDSLFVSVSRQKLKYAKVGAADLELLPNLHSMQQGSAQKEFVVAQSVEKLSRYPSDMFRLN